MKNLFWIIVVLFYAALLTGCSSWSGSLSIGK